ncbi:MAG TPA: hypothetical protein VLX85_03225 [Stellaceae bacterium]|nr:hypothetical protein [Stellaceae bacterium]
MIEGNPGDERLGDVRERIGDWLGEFVAALEGQDPVVIARARAGPRHSLAARFHPYRHDPLGALVL